MTEMLGIKIPMNPWVVLPLIVLAAVILAYLANIAILSILRRVVRKTATEFDDRIYRLVDRYLFPLLLVGGLLLILDVGPFPPKVLRAAHGPLALSGLLRSEEHTSEL